MDYGSPVAVNVDVSPNKGLATLSSLIGLQRQKQELQTGQYQQQTAQAGATVAQQTAKENQNGAALFADPVGNGLVDEQGNPTPGAYQKVKAAMPTTGDEKFKNMMDAAKGRVEYAQAYTQMTAAQRDMINSRVAGVAARPDANTDDLLSTTAGIRSDFAGTAAEPHVNKLLDATERGIKAVSSKQGPEGAKQFVLGLSRGSLGNAGITGSGGVAAPSNALVNTGDNVQPVVQQPALAGGGAKPAGAPLSMGMAPGTRQTLETDPQTHAAVYVVRDARGNIVSTRPASEGPPPPSVTGAPVSGPTRSAPPGAAPSAPQAPAGNGFSAPGTGAQIEGVNTRVQQALAQANNTVQSQDALTRARALLADPKAPSTGTGFENKKWIANFLSNAGFDTSEADSMNTLTKNLARYEATRAAAAGLGGTDAARELAHNGSPNTSLDNKALAGIVDQSLATEKALATYAKVQSKTTDPKQLLKNESDFRNIPNLVQGYEYGLTRNEKEANDKLAKFNLSFQQMKATRQQIKEFESR